MIYSTTTAVHIPKNYGCKTVVLAGKVHNVSDLHKCPRCEYHSLHRKYYLIHIRLCGASEPKAKRRATTTRKAASTKKIKRGRGGCFSAVLLFVSALAGGAAMGVAG